VGGEKAASVLAHLEIEQVEAISKEIAAIKGITADEAEDILDEFRSLLATPYGFSGGASGGIEAARRVLYAAFGPEKGEAFLIRAVPEAKGNPFDFLHDFSGEQLALLFRDESPAAAALVLSRLPPKLSAAVLGSIAPDRKLEIIQRIARLGPAAPEVLEQVAGALREKARRLGATETASMDGMNALAAILKSSDASFGDYILNELENKDPELGKTLKERIFTLEDLVQAEDRPIQKKLSSMDDRDIVLLLKGRSAAFREKVLANLSSGRRTQVLEEEEILGPVLKRDAEQAAGEFLAWFRQNREAGRILMLDSDDLVE
jgi:flagellar motor switch protein FliG